MTKEEFVNAIAKEAGFTKKDSAIVLDAAISVITKALSSGEEVRLIGFGAFRVREHLPRKARNPQTNTPVEIPRGYHPVFIPGKTLKDAVNAGFSDNV